MSDLFSFVFALRAIRDPLALAFQNANYTTEDLRNAIEAVRNGMSHRTAANQFGVPRTTLSRKIDSEDPERLPRGPSPVLGETEEDIVQWVKDMAKMGFPVTREALQETGRKLAKLAAKDGNPRAHQIVSADKWVRLFCQRHQDLALRTPEHISSAQANISEADIREYFTRITTSLRDRNLAEILHQPSRIFNADETGFALNPHSGKVMGVRGARHVHSAGGSDKENVTVLVCGSAAGHLAPSAIVLRRKRMPPAFTDLLRQGFCLFKSDKGWMTGATFLEYLRLKFIPFLAEQNIERPVLLFLDNHRSHLTMDVSDESCEFSRDDVLRLPTPHRPRRR
ncbi:tigger transposable element-derived protein 6-like [Galendromus occidentalis]|uniref:Tigger transposable element-derived protein 6-like n=1 Tax=Galendromus occidentalis TaxID=34638 RepID=A0AAJ6QNH2_9ACAR|nr:tigger transposable element-derived protein 6-like [Galendromus occidentalis]